MEAVVRDSEMNGVRPGLMTRAAARLVHFAEWSFGPQAPAIDLGLMLFAAGWAVLEVTRPQIFDTGAFVGLAWVSDPVWFGLHALLTVMHGAGLVRLHWRSLRAASAFLSAWHWLFVAASLFRIEMTTGVLAYGLLGLFALTGGIYLVGLPARRD